MRGAEGSADRRGGGGDARGGVLEPPASNKVAAVSARHAALDAQSGTSVLTWHVRYGLGCDGDLNALLAKATGDTFTIRTEKGTTTYRITGRDSFPQGQLKASWFDQSGPHRLSLFTCGGLRNGHFTTTTLIQARPVV